MTRQYLQVACGRFMALAAAAVLTSPVGATQAAAPQAGAGTSFAAVAAKDSPELVGQVSNAIGSSPEQAAGAAGALFGIAQTRLKPSEFSQVAAAVPGMASLLKAAPALGGSKGASSSLSQLAGTASTLAAAGNAFTKLGLKPEMVAKVIPVLTSFVTKSGGANVGNLLAGVLK